MDNSTLSIVWSSNITPRAKLVWLAYLFFADKKGKIKYPSIDFLANKTGLTREVTKKCLMLLSEKGFISENFTKR